MDVNMSVLIVIPARYGSSRFEGKPLVDIAGKSLIQRTWLQARKTNLNARVVVATDDERIFNHVAVFGEAVMTSKDHVSGTDRCFEVLDNLAEEFDILINLQGDEPFIQAKQIELLANAFDNPEVDIATLKKPLKTAEELFNSNIVKVICNESGKALYFSRQAIPFNRDYPMEDWVLHYDYYRHIGMYGFRCKEVNLLQDLKHSSLEKIEQLEQLRWLENGFNIHVSETHFVSPAIDTPEDLTTVDNFLKMNPDLV
jgi:3-deoxy-manno-octulosonate cytidylyltransferase (CMP-KDO synthetase)